MSDFTEIKMYENDHDSTYRMHIEIRLGPLSTDDYEELDEALTTVRDLVEGHMYPTTDGAGEADTRVTTAATDNPKASTEAERNAPDAR